MGGCRDAIQEQNNLRTLSQHRHGRHDCHHRERGLPSCYRISDPLHPRGQFATVNTHPQVVPAQHDHGNEENDAIEYFLAEAEECMGNCFSE
ncbi:hypothetical protein D3C78_1419090 [compost metagenome]